MQEVWEEGKRGIEDMEEPFWDPRQNGVAGLDKRTKFSLPSKVHSSMGSNLYLLLPPPEHWAAVKEFPEWVLGLISVWINFCLG